MIPLLLLDTSNATEPAIALGKLADAEPEFAFADILDSITDEEMPANVPEEDIEKVSVDAVAIDELLPAKSKSDAPVAETHVETDGAPNRQIALPKHNDLPLKDDVAMSKAANEVEKTGPTKAVPIRESVAQTILEMQIPKPAKSSEAVPEMAKQVNDNGVLPPEEMKPMHEPEARRPDARKQVEFTNKVERKFDDPEVVAKSQRSSDVARTSVTSLGVATPSPEKTKAVSDGVLIVHDPALTSDPPLPLPYEKAAVPQLQTSATAPQTATVETARHASHQLAVAVTEQPGKATEIALNPEELGRVRLSMSVVDGAINVSISAERQETSDLLRRHIDTLANEFRDLGYSDISFSFGQGDRPDDDSPTKFGSGNDHPEDHNDASPVRTTQMLLKSGLDIRL